MRIHINTLVLSTFIIISSAHAAPPTHGGYTNWCPGPNDPANPTKCRYPLPTITCIPEPNQLSVTCTCAPQVVPTGPNGKPYPDAPCTFGLYNIPVNSDTYDLMISTVYTDDLFEGPLTGTTKHIPQQCTISNIEPGQNRIRLSVDPSDHHPHSNLVQCVKWVTSLIADIAARASHSANTDFITYKCHTNPRIPGNPAETQTCT